MHATLTKEERNDILHNLAGWLRFDQLERIGAAIDSGKLDPEKFRSLSAKWVEQNFDNGGFTPREQYALEFANELQK